MNVLRIGDEEPPRFFFLNKYFELLFKAFKMEHSFLSHPGQVESTPFIGKSYRSCLVSAKLIACSLLIS